MVSTVLVPEPEAVSSEVSGVPGATAGSSEAGRGFDP